MIDLKEKWAALVAQFHASNSIRARAGEISQSIVEKEMKAKKLHADAETMYQEEGCSTAFVKAMAEISILLADIMEIEAKADLLEAEATRVQETSRIAWADAVVSARGSKCKIFWGNEGCRLDTKEKFYFDSTT
jgi:hypothetical protein